MALVVYDRVQQTTTTTGTGAITLTGTVSGYQSFAVVGNGNTTYYCIISGSSWEVGIGSYSTTGPTLNRTTILSSSNFGSAISLSGTSNVFVTYPASKSQFQNMTYNAVINTVSVGLGSNNISTNTAVGKDAIGLAFTTGTYNSAFGDTALGRITSGSFNTGLGSNAGANLATGESSVYIGFAAGGQATGGNYNTAIGRDALSTNVTGGGGTAVGAYALNKSTSAQNDAFGSFSQYNTSSGTNNVSVGQNSMQQNTTGGSNIAVGASALSNSNTASGNTAVGHQAGSGITNGGINTVLGYTSGNSITTGIGNTMLGGYTQPSAAGGNYQITIASGGGTVNGKGDSSGFINPNGGGVYQGNNSSSWSTTSDRRLKKNIVDNIDGLNKITAIQVRNFEYRLPEEVDAELKPSDAVPNKGVQLGVIAQELQQVLPECVKTESTGVMSVDTDNLTWYLINAVKELKAEFDAYKATHP
jgi:hypothetical protein